MLDKFQNYLLILVRHRTEEEDRIGNEKQYINDVDNHLAHQCFDVGLFERLLNHNSRITVVFIFCVSGMVHNLKPILF